MRDRAADFGGGVVDTLADRARDVGGLAYEAFTSDPNIGRMTTAEYAQAADRPTPRLDQAAQDLGTIGKAIVTQPVQTGKALVQGEVERARQAMTSPRAAGEYAGSMVDPMRIAAALRKTAPIAELDVYHGTPHRFEPTEENPLGEFDASKVGTGEGAQAYGHGVYLAESPDVAKGYAANVKDMGSVKAINAEMSVLANIMHTDEVPGSYRKYKTDAGREAAKRYDELMAQRQKVVNSPGSLYKADLPDQIIDRMLDYDKPLSEQTQSVRDVFDSLGFDVNTIKFKTDDELHKAASKYLRSKEAARLVNSDLNAAGDIYAARRAWNAGPQAMREYVNSANGTWLKGVLTGAKGADMSGGVAYQKLADSLGGWGGMVGQGGGQSSASRKLAELGIPGIRYLDAGSRGGDSATGTRNFVVFPGEEKKVKILKRD
jgi:hypothetical protein